MSTQFYAINVIDHVEGPGIKTRVPVQTISITNLDLATDLTGASVGGYTLVADDRFVAAGQTTATENGIYICATPTPYRAPDYDEGDMGQCFFTVLNGTYAGTEWQANGNGIVGTGSQNFVMKNIMSYSAGDIIYAGTNRTLEKLPAPVSNSIMIMNSDGIPTYYTSIPVENGGTGGATFTAGALILGNGTSGFNSLAPSIYKVLACDGTPDFALTNDVHLSSIQGSATTQKIINFTDNASAVNYLTLANSTTNPTIGVDGTGTDLNIVLLPKGAGQLDIKASANSQLNLWHSTFALGLRAPVLTSNLTFTFPAADGTAGQMLRTNGSGQLEFGSAGIDLTISSDPIIISSSSATAFATICYNVSAYGAGASATIYFEAVRNTNFNFIVYNVTGSTALSTTAITSSGFKTVSVTMPSVNSRIEFRVQRTAIGTSSVLYGVQMSI